MSTLTQRARYLRGARRCIRRCRQALHDYALPGRYRRRAHWQQRTHPLLRVAFTQLVRAYWLRGLARDSDEVRAERRRAAMGRVVARGRQLLDGPRAMRPQPGDVCECGRPR